MVVQGPARQTRRSAAPPITPSVSLVQKAFDDLGWPEEWSSANRLAFFEDLEEVAGAITEMLIAGDWSGLAADPDHIYYWVPDRLVALEMRGCRPI